jgi:hypothetical protein
VSRVDVDELERIRAEICASGPASDGDNLLGMDVDCFAYLADEPPGDEAPRPWHGMTVERSEGADWLITGRATGRLGDRASVASELSRIWDQYLRYGHRSAHAVISAPDSVTLRAVTQIGPGDIWVTADIQVALA